MVNIAFVDLGIQVNKDLVNHKAKIFDIKSLFPKNETDFRLELGFQGTT